MNRMRSVRAALVAAAVLAWARGAAAQGAVVNGDFDVDRSGWDPPSIGAWQGADGAGDPLSGSLRITNSFDNSNVQVNQCVPVNPGAPYVAGAIVRIASIDGALGSADVAISWRSSFDCAPASALQPYVFAIESNRTDWHPETSAVLMAPLDALAADLQLIDSKINASGTLFADFDAVTLPEPDGGTDVAGLALAALVLNRGRRRRAACPGAACAAASSRRPEPRPPCGRRSGG